jgi:membrane glycosyltransferase
VVARGEARAFGGVPRLAGGALLELLLSTLQAPLRMLAHCLYVLGAVTGLKLEWKSPPRGVRTLDWLDATRRIGALVSLPLVLGWGLVRRGATLSLAPMLLPLTLAVPFTVLTGHPRAGRAVARLGLLRTPEEWAPPRPLQRAGEHAGFADLAPRPAAVAGARRPGSPRHAGWRVVPVAATAVMAVLAAALPIPGVAPELPARGRALGDTAEAVERALAEQPLPEPAHPIDFDFDAESV